MATIKKKIWPEYFELVKSGKKKFELRLADFEIEEGDTLVLQEWNPTTKEYTGREIEVKPNYILKFDTNKFGQAEEIKKNGLYVIQLEDVKKYPKVGIGVILIKDSKVLLGKRHEDPNKADSQLHGEGTWTLPGGKLDFGENIEDCAARETLEETSIKINKDNIKIISVTNDKVKDAHFVTIGFLCEDFEGEEKVMEPDEITEWKWFDISNIPSPMFFPSEKAIKNFINKENKF